MRRTLLVLATLVFSSQAFAAAFYLGEIGTRSLARGGANVVNPADPSAMWLNPAAITNAKGFQLRLDNTVVQLGATYTRDCGANDNCGPVVGTSREYSNGLFAVEDERSPPDDEFIAPANKGGLGKFNTPSNFGDGHSVSNLAGPQYIPNLWLTVDGDLFSLPGFAIGLGAYAPYAGDYNFGADEYTRYTLIDRDLLELFYGLTLAYRYGDWFAVGVSLQGVTAGVKQTVKLSADRYGNENPDGDITINIDAIQHFIPSANAGVWVHPIKNLELGASVQLPRSVRAIGALELSEFGPEIQTLIDSGTVEVVQNSPQAEARFELPPFYRVGARWVNDDVYDNGFLGYDVEAAFVYEQWSTYNHVALITSGIDFAFAGGEPQPLAPVLQPKDYQDAWSVRLGGEVNLLDKMLAIRAGGFYETSAIPTSTLSVDLLNGEKLGFGTGVGVKFFGATLDLSYATTLIFDRVVGDESITYVENPVAGFNDEPRTRVAMGQYSINYQVFSAALGVEF